MVFEKGNVVRLKSGGPSMTVENVVKEGSPLAGISAGDIVCIWFDNGKLERKAFKPFVLEIWE